MSIETASSKINRWAALAEALRFKVTLDDEDLSTPAFESIGIWIWTPYTRYYIAASRYIGDGNRAKAFRHYVSRQHLGGASDPQRLQAREVEWWLRLDTPEGHR